MRYRKSPYATLLFAFPLAVGLLAATVSYAQQAGKPLGVLINTGAQPAGPAGSVLPPQTPLPTAPATAGNKVNSEASNAPSTDRPLGGLINVQRAPSSQPSSVLPQNWSQQRFQAPQRTTTQTISQSGTSQTRPLGTLFNDPNRAAPRSRTLSAPGTSTGSSTPPGTKEPHTRARDSDDTPRLTPIPGTSSAGRLSPTFNIFGTSTVAPESEGEVIPVDLTADSMTYDRELGLITASGNVQIVYGDRILIADRVTYNQKTDIVNAVGNASLQEGDGEVIFGDRFDITGDLKDGIIFNIGLVLADRSRVAGTGARRSNAIKTEVRNAVYSPCNLCEEDPDAAPVWQLKAVRVIHNSKEQRVEYRDAWLEVFGMPVAYIPYLSHPDPTVKRRSGLLAPSFSSSSELGFRFETPYFWAIDEYQDATITPLITTDAGKGAILEYNKNFRNGEIRATGSFVFDDPDRGERAYLDLESEFHLNRTWRAGLDVETASDDTYTRRYGFDTESVLTSRGYLEGFRGKNYQAVNAYAFDDLRSESESRNSPVIVPIYDFNYVGNKDRLGGATSFDFNAMNLVRETGDLSTRRISFRPRWARPFRGSFGDVYNASVSLAADGYHSSNVAQSDGTEFSGFAGRLHPKASLSWRLPLVRQGQSFNNTIEPVVMGVISPNVGTTDLIPNEDSPEIELDETSILSDDLFDGIDRVEGGARVSYGVNWVVTGQNDGSASFFLGQALRPRQSSNFGPGSGLDRDFSDIVGRVHFKPNNLVDATYRTQLSSENLEIERNELTGVFGPSALQASTSYIFIGQQPGSEFEGREEFNGAISSQMTENLSARFSSIYDVADSDLRSLGLSVVYEDECIKFTTQLSRSFFEDRDLRPEDRITFTVVLKTLGEFTTGGLN